MSDIPFRQRLEQANNPEEVRHRLAAGNYNQQHAAVAREWLEALDRKEVQEAASRAEEREREAVAIAAEALAAAKEANRIAEEDLGAARESASAAAEQARWAKWAAVIASVAAIFAARDEIGWLIEWLF